MKNKIQQQHTHTKLTTKEIIIQLLIENEKHETKTKTHNSSKLMSFIQ